MEWFDRRPHRSFPSNKLVSVTPTTQRLWGILSYRLRNSPLVVHSMNLAHQVKTSVTKQDLNLVLEYLYRNTLINKCVFKKM